MADQTPWSEYSAVYDLPDHSGSAQTYLLATTQRTGSHYLAYLLAQIGTVGVPFEYLNAHRNELELMARGWPVDKAAELRLIAETRRRRTGSGGWFGTKAHWHTWESRMADPAVMEIIQPVRFIALSRVDRVAQAVSLAIAEQTNVWVNSSRDVSLCPTYSKSHIDSAMARLASETDAWERYFAHRSAEVLRLDYEGLVAKPSEAVDAVVAHLGVTSPRLPERELPRMYSRSHDIHQEWVRRYEHA